ncbi:helix-turn-helix domain-containing protein [Streptococcus macedonicus]|uniref:helix-turn-helix domain-containing protein n=1 Tax=Streptococcus macedonicus TaxID=59310 RepID=UPI002243DAA4|nr:helix-turn-helix transcriptional regulator [Streptococcus macedonicus]MCW8645245.1 helix-turn-helix domain-containing protein [Streptococcus macedonicus]
MNRLKELRKEKGMSQIALAKELGVSYRTWQNWENGVSSIKPVHLKKLCEIFDVDVPYLLGYNNVKNETDIKVSVLDEALEKLRAINNMVSVESDEDPNMWTIGFRTAIVAIENFKKEIEFGGE